MIPNNILYVSGADFDILVLNDDCIQRQLAAIQLIPFAIEYYKIVLLYQRLGFSPSMNTMKYVCADDEIKLSPLLLVFELVQQIIGMDLPSFLLAHLDLLFRHSDLLAFFEDIFHEVESEFGG